MSLGRFLERCRLRRLALSAIIAVLMLAWGLPADQIPPALSEMTDPQKKAIVYSMYDDYRKSFPEVQEISVKEAMALHQSGQIVFVDIRKPQEMKVSMLPGAISRDEFLQNPSRYNDMTVVGYCTISYRSGLLAQKLSQEGITMVNLRGGILAWTLEGGKVHDQSGESKRIHVYGAKWNYAPQRYEAVLFGFWNRLF